MTTLNPTRYVYEVRWSEEDEEYVGSCPAFPSLSWLDVTPEDALSGVIRLVTKAVESLVASGESVPDQEFTSLR